MARRRPGRRRRRRGLPGGVKVLAWVLGLALVLALWATVIAPQPTGDPPAPSAATPTAGATVLEIVDGDTLEADLAVDGAWTVRLSQVDAPEHGTRVECYGPQATRRLRELLPPGTTVTLRRPAPPFRGDHGRLLAEVTVEGDSVNEALVRGGFARWGRRFADEDPDLAARLEATEGEARAAGRGLWSACRGDADRPRP